MLISGLVISIAAYLYVCTSNAWMESYEYSAGKEEGEEKDLGSLELKSIPLRYALMIVMIMSGYYGVLNVIGNLTQRRGLGSLSSAPP